MTEELKTYEEYVIAMKLKIALLMKKIYEFEKTDKNTGMYESSELAGLIIGLGTISDKLRPYMNNYIPTQYALLDEWLGSLVVEKIEILFLIGFIRGTFGARNGLNNWIALRDRIALKLKNEGHDEKSILRGLYN